MAASTALPVRRATRVLDKTARQARVQATPVLTLSLPPELADLVERAAKIRKKSSEEFVIETMRQVAIDTICDNTQIELAPEAFEAFQRMLDAPPNPNENLRKTMSTRAPWER